MMKTLHRREYLRLLSGWAAGVCSGALLYPSTARKVPVGAHLWVYAAGQPQRDPTPVLDQVFQELGAAGLDGIELMQTVLRHDGAVDRVRELSARHRLPVIGCSWAAPTWDRGQHKTILGEAQALLGRLRELKARTLGMTVGYPGRKKTPQELDAQAEVLRQLVRMCSGEGIVLNLHNHTWEVAEQEYDLKETLARVPEARLGPDLEWLMRAKVDPVDFIRRYGARIVFCHLRDEKADGTWPESIGEGVMNFAAIGRALRGIGFAGDLVIELAHERGFVPTRSYGESFRLSREYLRKTMRY
jgi:sugar phosphate isomerase/epimerase